MPFIYDFPARSFDRLSEALAFHVSLQAHHHDDQLAALNANVPPSVFRPPSNRTIRPAAVPLNAVNAPANVAFAV